MPENAKVEVISSRREAIQALGLMIGALCMAAAVGHEKQAVVLAVFSFCILLMTLVATTLFLLEGRLKRNRPDRLPGFCLPATGILGFSAALFVAAGSSVLTTVAFLVAVFLSAYRRGTKQGAFNLIPATALDLGLVGGIGAAGAGILLVALNLYFF